MALPGATLLRNGCLLTCGAPVPGQAAEVTRWSWMLFSKDGISKIGSGDPPADVVEEAVHTVDAHGKVVLPGLGDAHCHVYELGKSRASVNLQGAASMEDLQRRLADFAAKYPGKPVLGAGWDQELLGSLPTRDILDAAVKDQPVIVHRRCYHVVACNSAALQHCKVDSGSSVEGGVVDKNEDGEPTGILREGGIDLVKPILEGEAEPSDQCRLILDAMQAMVARGVTHCQTNDSRLIGNIDMPYARYTELADKGLLPLRIFLTICWTDVGKASYPEAATSHHGGMLSCRRAKLWTDGGLGASTAAMLQPYSDNPETSGVMQMSEELIAEAVNKCCKANFQIEAHAIGDRAARDLLAEFGRQKGHLTTRPVITHCQFLNAELVKQMANLGVVANVQPQFVVSDEPIVSQRVGKSTERFRYSYAWRSLHEGGVAIAGGSDAPVEDPRPLHGIYDFVTHILHQEQRLSFADALAAYTTGAAYATEAEDRLGRLEVGFEADFVITDLEPSDVDGVDPVALKRSDAVREVWVAGKCVHTATGVPDSIGICSDGKGKEGSEQAWKRGFCPCPGCKPFPRRVFPRHEFDASVSSARFSTA